MTVESLNNQTKEQLVKLVLEMGHVIRSLDEDSANIEFWTNDEDETEEINKAERDMEFRMALLTDKFYGDNSRF